MIQECGVLLNIWVAERVVGGGSLGQEKPKLKPDLSKPGHKTSDAG